VLRLNDLEPFYHGETGVRMLRGLSRCYPTSVKDLSRVMNRLKALYRSWAIPAAGRFMLGGMSSTCLLGGTTANENGLGYYPRHTRSGWKEGTAKLLHPRTGPQEHRARPRVGSRENVLVGHIACSYRFLGMVGEDSRFSFSAKRLMASRIT